MSNRYPKRLTSDKTGEVGVNLVSTVNFLKEFSPTLGRPHLDTLNGSSFSNMKEIRFSSASGIWRASKSIAYQLGNLA